jgi:hypothetical protein
MKNQTLRCYWVGNSDLKVGWSLLSYTAKEAKKYFWNFEYSEGCEFIDLKVQWQRDVDLSKIITQTAGHLLTYEEAFKSGAFGFLNGDIDACEACECDHENCDDCPIKLEKIENDDWEE